MKRLLLLGLSLVLVLGFMILPGSAAIFQLSYYTENVYAGGIIDMFAFVDRGDPDAYTYQWQVDLSIGDGKSWSDLEENARYVGTKTNHLQMITMPGNYGDWENIPFACKVTDSEGTTFYTPNIYAYIYPTNKLFPDMRKWGKGLEEPSILGVSGQKSSDGVNYTASTPSGTNLQINCFATAGENRPVLEHSEVELIREIQITEKGQTIKVGSSTGYTPYTVGTNAVKVELILRCTINGQDLGVFDSKTVQIHTTKPTVSATAKTKTDCSLLRYTYNESQKLTAIPKGTAVEIVQKTGSYYQVFYNNMVGYVGTGLLDVPGAYDPVIKTVDVTIPEPVAGKAPSFACKVLTPGCGLYSVDPVTWIDKETKAYVGPGDRFLEGHSYTLTVWLAADSGYRFQVNTAGQPNLKGAINGDKPPYIHKAYEQDPREVIELTYDFNNIRAQAHQCAPQKVAKVLPTCTQQGHEAYYRCECGASYSDGTGTNPIDPANWGILAPTGHTPGAWTGNGTHHYRKCTHCREVISGTNAPHSGGTATCQQKAQCTVCGLSYGTPDTDHRWGPKYDYKDKNGHAWVCADCKTHDSLKPHTPGPDATETNPQTCKDCGYIITPAKNHTHKLTLVAAKEATCLARGNRAYYTCDGCGTWFADARGETPVEPESVSLPALGHFSGDWQWDQTGHWQDCRICQAPMLSKELHLDVDGDGLCETCLQDVTQLMTQPTQAETEEPQTPETTQPTVAPTRPDGSTPVKEKEAFPWLWVILGIEIVFLLCIGTTILIMRKKKKG